MAGVLFIVPGVISIMALSYIYAAYGKVGLSRRCSSASRRPCWPSCWKPCSGSASARSRTTRHARARRGCVHRHLFLPVPFPVIVFGAGLDRFCRRQWACTGISRRRRPWPSTRAAKPVADSLLGERAAGPRQPDRRAARCAAAAVWLALWLVPVAAMLLDARRPTTSSATSRFSFQQDGDGDVRRRLCRARLCRAAGG